MSRRGRSRLLQAMLAAVAVAATTMTGTLAAAADDGADGTRAMTIAAVDAGSISGTVTRESDDQPVEGIAVFRQSVVTSPPRMTFTDQNGEYRFDDVAAGDHIIWFSAPDSHGLAMEYWDGVATRAEATAITVVAGEERSGIDASMQGLATISGTVTRETDGSPVTGAVEVFSDAGSWSGAIEPDGTYSVAVAAGTHLVRFQSSDDTAAAEYWEDAATEEAATPITVTPGEVRTGIDAELASVAAITGTIFVGGAPLAESVIVEAWSGGEFAGIAYSRNDGTYRLALPAGDYTLRAGLSEFGIDWGLMYYRDAKTASEATSVTLGSTDDVTGIDFTLEPGADIQGVVTTSGATLPSEGAAVTALLWSNGEWREVATINTLDVYRFGSDDPFIAQESGPLPAGEYRIRVAAEGFCTRYSGGATSLEKATSIWAGAGGTFPNIDVTLTPSCDAPAPALTLSAGTIRAGGSLTVTGSGFGAGESVAFELHSDPIALGSLTADQNGRISGVLRIPASAPVGAHTLVALRAGGTIQASAALQVTAAASTGSATAPDRLAATGAEVPTGVLLMGLFLTLIGAVLVRRRRAQS
ncbi:carboxypeptidase regulatory-like domain-containing protein [Microbacterium sp. NPDC089696]|uniref:carboxypeptidase regulatory-like domain-containing protein n=1 Tax=Microbacterium sp. NPDC089696 TaxID=3364199 RepID=UPI00380EAF5F